MKKLFRVALENDITVGMYSCSQDVSWSMSSDNGRHPVPNYDNRLCDFWAEYGNSNFFFGFSTKEQLTFWVYLQSVRRELEENNFVVYEIAVHRDEENSTWKAGDTQAVFHINHYELVSKTKLSDFFRDND